MARSVVERTLSGLTDSIEQSLFAEEIARQPGALQVVDPRVKIIGFLAILLAVAFARNLWVLLCLYAFALLLAWVSRVPLARFVKRVWLALPFFTGLVALPVIFSFITPGIPLVVLSTSPYIAITEQGVRAAAFLILRVGTSVSFAVLLVLVTPWATLLRALSVLKVPAVFLLVLGMTYRYIYLLLRTASDMFLARQSRVVGRMKSTDQRRVVTQTMGNLLGKSYDMSQDVYLAMLSRGYRGRPRTLDQFKMTGRDWLWVAGLVTVAIVAGIAGGR
ncbi:MAG: cobalt ECF transporter T component CbiQ [Anaerolineae bacterium]